MSAITVLLLYLAVGFFCIRAVLPDKSPLLRVWLGLSLGILLLMWLPALAAFFVKFTLLAEYIALFVLLALGAAAVLYQHWHPRPLKRMRGCDRALLLQLICFALPLTALSAYLQHTHTLQEIDGALWVGQSTYGDMCMHTSIIMGLRGSSLPSEYLILPGTVQGYPILVDAMSTSLLLLGLPLRWSIIVPGTVMSALVYSGYLLFAHEMTGKPSVSLLAAVLLFFNGGLGFLYDFDLAGYDQSSIVEIFTGYYKTPANRPDQNLRWSNLIVDLLLPQRTFLGGWTLLIPALYFAREASRTAQRRMFWLAALFGAALPLVHTHSFLCLGLYSGGALLYSYFTRTQAETSAPKAEEAGSSPPVSAEVAGGALEDAQKSAGGQAASALEIAAPKVEEAGSSPPVSAEVAGGALEDAQKSTGEQATSAPEISAPKAEEAATSLLPTPDVRPSLSPRAAYRRALLTGTAIYLAVVVLAALPQMAAFTFRQATKEGFMRLHFNWVNHSVYGFRDFYLWFWLKNIGLPLIAILCGVLNWRRRDRMDIIGALPIFIIAETVLLQPLDYDNNKLFYVWYLLMLPSASLYLVSLWQRMRGQRARALLAGLFITGSTLSGALSVARETISHYQLFSAADAKVARYIDENTDRGDMFITGLHHNNPVYTLAGRKVVCGPGIFLHTHGLDYEAREAAVKAFYLEPAANLSLIDEYGVDYIVVGLPERVNMQPDEEALGELFTLIYNVDGTRIYAAGNNQVD